jgi:hypothetical protein
MTILHIFYSFRGIRERDFRGVGYRERRRL